MRTAPSGPHAFGTAFVHDFPSNEARSSLPSSQDRWLQDIFLSTTVNPTTRLMSSHRTSRSCRYDFHYGTQHMGHQFMTIRCGLHAGGESDTQPIDTITGIELRTTKVGQGGPPLPCGESSHDKTGWKSETSARPMLVVRRGGAHRPVASKRRGFLLDET